MTAGTTGRGSTMARRIDQAVGPILIRLVAALARARAAMTSSVRPTSDTTLIVCFGAIGDLLLLSATSQSVRPAGRWVLACTPENKVGATVFDDLYEAVEVVSLRDLRSLSRVVAKHGITTVVDSTQWANVSALQLAFARLRHPRLSVTGFGPTGARDRVYDELVDHSGTRHEVQNFAALLGDETFDSGQLVGAAQPSGRVVALHLWPSGTRSHLKEWPRGSWIELARALHDAGCDLVATGGPADREPTAAFIEEAAVPIDNLAGAVGLDELYRRFSEDIRVCVSVNTGTMHLAALAGAGVVALNGPTNPTRWGPIGPRSVSLQPSGGNFGYLHYGFEYPERDEDAYALDRLAVDTVLSAALRLVDPPRRRRPRRSTSTTTS